MSPPTESFAPGKIPALIDDMKVDIIIKKANPRATIAKVF
jgi:hypothetical protein